MMVWCVHCIHSKNLWLLSQMYVCYFSWETLSPAQKRFSTWHLIGAMKCVMPKKSSIRQRAPQLCWGLGDVENVACVDNHERKCHIRVTTEVLTRQSLDSEHRKLLFVCLLMIKPCVYAAWDPSSVDAMLGDTQQCHCKYIVKDLLSTCSYCCQPLRSVLAEQCRPTATMKLQCLIAVSD